MNQKRVIAIHDISCVGKCSLTVALPIISAAGIETSVIPTAVLSTHTGNFKGYTYRDLTNDILPIVSHWDSLNLRADAFYTGFLGSLEQVDIVLKAIDMLKDRQTLIFVDPVMADNGSLYKTFTSEFPRAMKKLCEKADIIVPNITEATLLLGKEYRQGPYTEDYIKFLLRELSGLGPNIVVLTGVYFDEKKFGAACYNKAKDEYSFTMSDKINGFYHGTGDVFASALVGACLNEIDISSGIDIAVKYTSESILRTQKANTDVRYGVNFEEGIGGYIRMIEQAKIRR